MHTIHAHTHTLTRTMGHSPDTCVKLSVLLQRTLLLRQNRQPATLPSPDTLAQPILSLSSIFPFSLSAYFVLFLSVLCYFPLFISPFSHSFFSIVFASSTEGCGCGNPAGSLADTRFHNKLQVSFRVKHHIYKMHV